MKRWLAIITALVLSLPSPLSAEPQPPPQLQISILDGEGALNNIKQQTAREPIVVVTDENHKPVAGALVIFTLPHSGAGGTFADGSLVFQDKTDAAGRVATSKISPNQVVGNYQITVQAAYNGLTAKMLINQRNYMGASATPTVVGHAAFPLKAVLFVTAATAAAAAVAIIATGSSSSGATITPVSGTVTAPSVRRPSGARQ